MTPGRFLLRILILIPLGAFLAVCTSVTVLLFTHWRIFAAALNTPDLTQDQFFTAIALAPMAFFWLTASGLFILLPAVIGVVIAEAFAIRSFVFHVANGALSSFVGWYVAPRLSDAYPAYGDPRFIVAAGAAAGLVYWLIAGRGAGADPAPPPLRTT